MAREAGPYGSESTAGAWARRSADKCIQRLQRELREARAGLQQVIGLAEAVPSPEELTRRVGLVAVTLGLVMAGARPSPMQLLQRNVAAHAAVVPAPGASAAAWRAAQRGPRLQFRARPPAAEVGEPLCRPFPRRGSGPGVPRA